MVVTQSLSKSNNKDMRNTNSVSWWDQERTCNTGKKKTTQKFKITKRMEDYIEYKRLRAQARKIIKQKKKEDLHKFAASLNKKVNIKYVWNKMKVLKKGWSTIEWHKWQIKEGKGNREND